MRTILSLIVVLVSVVGLTGCGGTCCSSSSAESSSPASIQSEPRVVESHPAYHGGGGSAVHVDDTSFSSEIGDYKGAAIVDFNATWCGPCRKISPVVEALASEMAGRVKVGKLDIDKSPQTANQFDVHAVPCIVLFVDGKEVGRTLGYQSKSELQGWIESQIPAAPAASTETKTAGGIATLVE